MSQSDAVLRIADSDALSTEQLTQLCPEDIQRLVHHLKDEADRYWHIDPYNSIEIAKKIQQIGTLINNLGTLALGTMALGDAKKLVGQPQDAWQLLGEAGRIYRQIDDEVGWARTRIGRVYVSPDVDCVDEAVADAVRAREILLDSNHTGRCIWLEMNLGTVHYRLGDTKQSLRHYDNALQIAEQLGSEGEVYLWPILYNIAVADIEMGHIQEAAANYERAIDIAVSREETSNTIYAMTGRGYLFLLQGKYRESLRLLNQTEDLSTAENDLARLFARRVMVECYLHLNRHLEARDLALGIVADFEGQGMPHEAALTRFHLAAAEATLGHYEAALQHMDQAKSVLVRSRGSIWLARQQVQRARVLLKLGMVSDAHDLILVALEGFEPECLNYALATLLKGEIALTDGRLDHAKVMAMESLAIARKMKSLEVRYSAYCLLGQIAEASDRPNRALRYYHAAVASLERSYRHLTVTLRPCFLKDKSEALRALVSIQLANGNATGAYSMLERAKSLILMGYLANQDAMKWQTADPKTAQLIDELNQLREEHTFFHYRVFDDFNATKEDQSAAAYAKDVDALHVREKRIRKITDRLYILNERTTLVKDTAIPPLEDVQQGLSANDILIEYFNDGERLWAFVIDGKDIEVHPLPDSIVTIDALTGKLQANLDWALQTDRDDVISHKLTIRFQQIALRLYDSLLRPIAHRTDGHKRLIVVPFGELHYLPFNALYDGERYLIEKQEIVIMPASSLLTRKIAPQARGARVLAHSWDGRLPKTHAEASDVYASLGGEIHLEQEATRAILSRPPLKVLHIAAHGEYRIDVPQLSYIHLADGQLFFDDALQEDLSYELVVLSGCETGRANIMPGDEVIGLGRGFLYAGAGAILASLWFVDDSFTHTLMRRFYEHLAKGDSKARSVRTAQQELLGEDPDLHPAFWGTFQLIGDPSPLSKD